MGVVGLSACGPHTPAVPPPLATVPLSAIEEGQRLVVLVGVRPVEMQRIDGTIVARSLLCTHMGCRVLWHAELARYRCTCHGGEYSDDGTPLAGPPPAPLERVPFTIEGDSVIFRT